MPSGSRLLLAVIAVLVIVAQPLASLAAARPPTATPCCCPKPETCECHDHRGKQHGSEIKRCGTGSVPVVAPVLAVAVTPVPVSLLIAPPATSVAASVLVAIP